MLRPYTTSRVRRSRRAETPKDRRCGPTTVARTELGLYGSAEHHPRRWGRESIRRPQAKRGSRSPRRVSAKPPRVLLGPLGGFCFNGGRSRPQLYPLRLSVLRFYIVGAVSRAAVRHDLLRRARGLVRKLVAIRSPERCKRGHHFAGVALGDRAVPGLMEPDGLEVGLPRLQQLAGCQRAWLPAGQGDGDVDRDFHVAQDAAVAALGGAVDPLDAPHGQRVLRFAALVLGAEPADLIAQRAGARPVDVVELLAGDDRRPRRRSRVCRPRRGRRRGSDLG